MQFSAWLRKRPLTGAILFEATLLLLALVLARVFGLAPWSDLTLSWRAIAVALLATAPLVVAVALLFESGFGWVRELESLTHRTVEVIFRDQRRGGVAAVALAAGFGEEFLFRGVIQAGLTQPLGPIVALGTAALLFGLAHAISLAYFAAAALIGLYLGLLYHVTGNLLIVCLVHALYDWAGVHYYLRRQRSARR
jgi:uncharacterized protein